MNDGFFPSDSAMWRLNREHFVLLGGSAAAILQAAHPMVAMGVAAHSEFRDDPLGRLRRTLDAVYAIAFGTKEDVEQVMRTVRAAHARVKGDTPQKYSAMDPDAQMWVLATLIMTTVEMHRRCATPPSLKELNRFYADMRLFGLCFGLDSATGPQTWDQFSGYYEAMISGPLLGSHPLCAEVANAILSPRRPIALRLLAPLLMPLACDYVPEPVRTRLHLPGRRWHRPATWVFERCVRLFLPILPNSIRYGAAYRQAVSKHQGTQGRQGTKLREDVNRNLMKEGTK